MLCPAWSGEQDMYAGQLVFSQVMEHLPMHTFRRCVQRYRGNRHVKSFTCLDQFLCMAFAQLTHRESLRDIEVCLRAHQDKLYHMGIRGRVSRNTLAHANKTRDWRMYAEFAQALIRIARPLYAKEDLGLDIDGTVYALDSSTIDLVSVGLSVGAVSVHQVLRSRCIPCWICAVTYRHSYTFPMARCTMSMFWTG